MSEALLDEARQEGSQEGREEIAQEINDPLGKIAIRIKSARLWMQEASKGALDGKYQRDSLERAGAEIADAETRLDKLCADLKHESGY